MYEEREIHESGAGDTQRIETYHEAPAAEVHHVREATYDPHENRRIVAEKLVQAIYLVFGLIEALLAIRFVLLLLNANPGASFAAFIYGITDVLEAPFTGMFGNPGMNGSVLDVNALVALVVYALVAWLLARLVWLLLGDSGSALITHRQDVETRVH